MTPIVDAPAAPSLSEDAKNLVRRTLAAGLADIDAIKPCVAAMMADTAAIDARSLADALVGGGVLTRWHAKKLLGGAAKGFYLGNYKLLRPLGRGGMGYVYLGEHHVMKRRMALKVLPPDSTTNADRVERFKAEAAAIAQLDHENIVRAYDFGQCDEKLYMVMEYVDGVDLGTAIARDGVLSPSDALHLMTQAVAGVRHAHDRGIVHRDLKPANLLLRGDGVLKVGDFGLARMGVQTIVAEDSGRLIGTADYLAPEQAVASATVDARADVYALGCTLYYLLTGTPPLRGDSVRQTLARHRTAPPPDVRDLRPEVPAAVAELCRRMMAKRPDDRPRSAAELQGILQRLGGRPANRDVLGHADSGDTIIELSGPTLDGSAPSGVTSIPTDFDVDFANLPSIEPAAVAAPPARPPEPTAAKPQPPSQNQGVMLGVGLTLAVLSLVAVGGLVYRTLTAPLPQRTVPIKVTETDKGHVVIQPGRD